MPEDVVVLLQAQPKLFHIVDALSVGGGGTYPLHRRDHQGDEHADDGDDRQQLDQGEGGTKQATCRFHFSTPGPSNALSGKSSLSKSRLSSEIWLGIRSVQCSIPSRSAASTW